MTKPHTPPTTLPMPIEAGLRSLIPGIVRTLIPLVVLVLVRIGFVETSINTPWIESTLTVVVTMGYYVVVRLLERYWPKIGWLLGYPAQPLYVPGNVVPGEVVAVTVEKD